MDRFTNNILNQLNAERATKKARKASALKLLRKGVMPPAEDLRLVKAIVAFPNACSSGRADLVMATVRMGPLNAITGISEAAEKGHEDIVRLIIDRYPFVLSDPPSIWSSEIARAIYVLRLVNGKVHPDLAQWLERGFEINYECMFVNVAALGNLPALMRLDKAVGHAMKGWTFNVSCGIAAEKGYVDVLEYLESNHSVDTDYSIMGACRGRQREIVEKLSGRPIKRPHQVFEAACKGGDIEIIKRYIEFGSWREVLSYACAAGYIDVVRTVLEMESIEDASERIELACLGKHYDVLSLLLSRCKYSSLCYTLDMAARHKDSSLVRFLLTYTPPDSNPASPPDPNAAMHIAGYNIHAEVLALLIANGARNYAAAIRGMNEWLDYRLQMGFAPFATAHCVINGEEYRLSEDWNEMGEEKLKKALVAVTDNRKKVAELVRDLELKSSARSISATEGEWKPFFDDESERRELKRALAYLDCCYELMRHF